MDKNKIIRHGKNKTCKLKFDIHNNELEYFTFDSLDNTGIVKHMFSTRKGGVSDGYLESLNFSYSQGDVKERVDRNYEIVAKHFGISINDMVTSAQTHTTNVRRVTFADKGKGLTVERDYDNVDGLITNEPGIMLCTFYADCVPLFIVDVKNKAIGLSHSGWRGTVGKMGQVTLQEMNKYYGTKPEDVKVAIAPSICQKCYEVSEDVAGEFADNFTEDEEKAVQYLRRYKESCSKEDIEQCLIYKKNNDKYQLNLWYANYRVFRDYGVPDENIELTDVCTCCNHELLFSHRATNGKRGNLGAFLMLDIY